MASRIRALQVSKLLVPLTNIPIGSPQLTTLEQTAQIGALVRHQEHVNAFLAFVGSSICALVLLR